MYVANERSLIVHLPFENFELYDSENKNNAKKDKRLSASGSEPEVDKGILIQGVYKYICGVYWTTFGQNMNLSEGLKSTNDGNNRDEEHSR